MDEQHRTGLDQAPQPVAAGTDPRRYYAVIALLLVVIVLLAIRPWDLAGGPAGSGAPAAGGLVAGATAASAGRPPAAGSAVPGESAGASAEPVDPYAELEVTCGSPSGWRAASVQVWSGRSRPIRSWIAIDPVEAEGPLDPRIPFAPVATETVTAIGYCAPLSDELRPPSSATAALWALTGGIAVAVVALPIEPVHPSALGVLWAPGQAGTELAAWPPGRYVIEITSGGGYRRWLGIELEDLARLRGPFGASPSPSAAVPASPSGPAPPSASAAP